MMKADTSRPANGRARTAGPLIGGLLALLGFALAVQLRSNASNDSLAGARQDDLARILDDQNGRVDRLQQQIGDLQAAKQKLSAGGTDAAAAREEAQKQADALAVLTGTVAAHGPGIEVTISDPGKALKAEDLLDVVEELRGAGAEVIQFGPVRVTTGSSFTDDSSGVQLDGVQLTLPYLVQAIGDPKTMDTALNIQGGVVDTVGAAGGVVTIRQITQLSITAVHTITQPKYASPAPK
jgi:uncharacterized protein YlxW (UPF0749 family)